MKYLPVLNVFEILVKEKYKDSNIQYNSKHTWKHISEKSCDLEFEVKAKSFTEVYNLLVPCKKVKKFKYMVIAQIWIFTLLGSFSIKNPCPNHENSKTSTKRQSCFLCHTECFQIVKPNFLKY